MAIPSGALDSSILITVERSDSVPPLPPGASSVGLTLEIGPNGIRFNKVCTLIVPYDASQVSNEKHLMLMVFNDTEESWQYIASTQDTSANRVVGLITHFSSYSMIYWRWSANSTITWRILGYPTNAPGYSDTQVHDAVERAFANWAVELNKVGITFQESKALFVDIGVFWTDASFYSAVAYTGLIRYYGVAIWRYSTGSWLIQCYNSLLFDWGNTQRHWAALTEDEHTLGTDYLDVENAITHEVGHALGLSHIGLGWAPPIMAPTASWQALHELYEEDIMAVRDKYDIPEVIAVHFPDPNLEAVIRETINKPAGDIYASELLGIHTLWAIERGITDLTGMEYCENIEHLVLSINQISDISPLSGLTSLQILYLPKNQISDISPLSGLTSLQSLHLWLNQIIDISPVSGLTSLQWVHLSRNLITDISPLSGLADLQTLFLSSNQISDISPLSGLTDLQALFLYNNQIIDISPLVSNPGLGAGDTVDVRLNPLSETSINEYIPILQARGVSVWWW